MLNVCMNAKKTTAGIVLISLNMNPELLIPKQVIHCQYIKHIVCW